MGLFDFFKKKENSDTKQPEAPENELFSAVSRYKEYIVLFMGMQQQENYAPIAAYEKPGGEIVGFVYVMGDDNTYILSAEEAVQRMESNFEQQLAANEMASYVIFYHSQFSNDGNHTLANSNEELKAITVAYSFNNGHRGKIGLPYYFDVDELSYGSFEEFSPEENNSILRTQLMDGKDYFQHREEIVAPVIENEAGLKITRSNCFDLSNTWCGIFGFERYRQPNGSQVLEEHFALAMAKGTIKTVGPVSIAELDYEDVILRSVLLNGEPKTILPVIKTDAVIDVVNKEINEWENIDCLEAIVTGNGRDTFGLTYFATDYAENREIYQTQKAVKARISGIAFVLDSSTLDTSGGEIKYSEDFTMYMLSKDLPNYACFDFIGQLEDFKETSLLENHSLKGYMMKVRLITNPDIKDFFTIDMYVAPENMRMKELTKGMKITGMFQMQGQIAK